MTMKIMAAIDDDLASNSQGVSDAHQISSCTDDNAILGSTHDVPQTSAQDVEKHEAWQNFDIILRRAEDGTRLRSHIHPVTLVNVCASSALRYETFHLILTRTPT